MAETTAALELPIGVTESRVLQQLARIESQLRKLQAKVENDFVKANQRVAASFRPVEQAAAGMSRETVASLQNVSYQIQDIFVQIQGGQGVMRAFSQQMPQLLSGFGLAGAAAGLATSIGFSLIPALIGAKEEAMEADKAIRALSQALDDYGRHADMAMANTEELKRRFGEFAGQVRDTSRGLAESGLARVFDAVGDALDPIKGGLAEVAELSRKLAEAEEYAARVLEQTSDPQIIEMAQSEVDILRGKIDDVARSMGLTTEQAQHLNRVIDRIDTARLNNDLVGMRDAANAARLEIEAMVGGQSGLRAAPEPLRAVYEALAEAAIQTAEAAEKQGELNDLISRAVALAQDLWANTPGSGWLQAEISEVLQLAKAWIQAGAAKAQALQMTYGVTEGDGSWYAGMTAEDLLPPKRFPGLKKRPAKTGKKGGGRSKGRGREDRDPLDELLTDTSGLMEQVRALERFRGSVDDAERALEALEQTQRLLNQAQRAGIEITPEYRARVEQAAEDYVKAKVELDRLRETSRRGEDAMGDLFDAIIDGAGSAKQAMADLLKEIAKVQLKRGLFSLLGLAGGGGLLAGIGQLLEPNANGGVYGGAGISAYSGKVVSKPTVFPFAKGIGLMGEAGPEAILPLARINGKLGVRAEGLPSAGGGAVDVRVYVDESGHWQAKVEQISGRVAAQAVAKQARAQSDQQYLSARR